MVPARELVGDELHGDALGRLLGGHLANCVGLAAGVAAEDLQAEYSDVVGVAVHHRPRLDHHPAQLVVGVAGLDLQRHAAVALEVARLLRLRVRPRPQLTVAHDVPERHEVGQPSRPFVAQTTMRCSAMNAATSSSVILIWSRRLTPRVLADGAPGWRDDEPRPAELGDVLAEDLAGLA